MVNNKKPIFIYFLVFFTLISVDIYIWLEVEETKTSPSAIQQAAHESLCENIEKQFDKDMNDELQKMVDAINYQQGLLLKNRDMMDEERQRIKEGLRIASSFNKETNNETRN